MEWMAPGLQMLTLVVIWCYVQWYAWLIVKIFCVWPTAAAITFVTWLQLWCACLPVTFYCENKIMSEIDPVGSQKFASDTCWGAQRRGLDRYCFLPRALMGPGWVSKLLTSALKLLKKSQKVQVVNERRILKVKGRCPTKWKKFKIAQKCSKVAQKVSDEANVAQNGLKRVSKVIKKNSKLLKKISK